jgi:hypothetical protein
LFAPGEKTVLALMENDLVRISVFGSEEPQKLYPIEGAIKLVGLNKEDPDQALILIQDKENRILPKLLSVKSGALTDIPYDPESDDNRQKLSHLIGTERVYENTTIYVKNETQKENNNDKAWTDVYIKQGDRPPVRISQCNGIDCGQPSLSPEGGALVFIKAKRRSD